METKANYVLVGIFTLVAIVAAFGFVYWTATVSDRGETAQLRVLIPGSASGLAAGSTVLFNGVPIGTVKRVYLAINDPTIAIADTEIVRLTPMTKSTQADIGIAGLTGQANIELRGANLKEPKLIEEAERDRHDSRDHGQSVGGDEPARNRAGHLQAGRFGSRQPPGVRHRRARSAYRHHQQRQEILGGPGRQCRWRR